jgi:hypothetical protein
LIAVAIPAEGAGLPDVLFEGPGGQAAVVLSPESTIDMNASRPVPILQSVAPIFLTAPEKSNHWTSCGPRMACPGLGIFGNITGVVDAQTGVFRNVKVEMTILKEGCSLGIVTRGIGLRHNDTKP